jgi:aconitase B
MNNKQVRMNTEILDLQNKIISFTEKAYLITRECVRACDSKNPERVNDLIGERDKVLSIIQSYQENLSIYKLNDEQKVIMEEFKTNLSKIISSIIKKDEYILEYLNEEKKNMQSEIAKVYQNKENLKGYNLNNLK